jgi:mannose-6-phosphate isomerase-like protein (cupin superfamily)
MVPRESWYRVVTRLRKIPTIQQEGTLRKPGYPENTALPGFAVPWLEREVFHMRKLISAVLVGVISSSIFAAGDTRSADSGYGTYLSSHDLAAKIVHGGGPPFEIPGTVGYKVLDIERTTTGEAEVHMDLNDIFVVQQGHAKILVGGQIKGNHETAPSEWRGGEITGGKEYALAAGDVLLIPAGLPHKAIVTEGPFTYLAIKTRKAP